MSEIRKDPFSEAFVIYSPERENRPNFTGVRKYIELTPENCPFCAGNEDMTPPEIFRIGDNASGWKTRVIPNKFPVLGVEEKYREMNEGFFKMFKSAGAHEIVIETPIHSEDILRCGPEYYRNIFVTYRERIKDLKRDSRLKYVQIFKNYKASAGATISHNHSQLIALPFIPAEVKRKLIILKDFYEKDNRSLFSEIISAELEHRKRIVSENDKFIAVNPWYSRNSFQIAFYQKKGCFRFEDISDMNLEELSKIFDTVMRKLVNALGDLPFNLLLHNAPFEEDDHPYFNWYLEILPALEGTGGFESATGVFINSVLPEKAAEILGHF